MATGESYRETEILSNEEKYNEFILTGLRTVWGVDLHQLKNQFGEELHRYALKNARKFIDSGLLACENGVYFYFRWNHERIDVGAAIFYPLTARCR